VPLLGEMGLVLRQQRDLLFSQGSAATAKIAQLKQREEALLAEAETDFPLNKNEVEAFRDEMAAHVQKIDDLEETAVTNLKEAML
jgi:ElaB/YqjD/DUF883 family membrane-anchored ribosome-binding protein